MKKGKETILFLIALFVAIFSVYALQNKQVEPTKPVKAGQCCACPCCL